MESGKGTFLSNYEETAEKLLYEKYHREFAVEKIISNNIFEKYCTALAYELDDPNTLFRVYINDDGKAVSDDYIDRLMEKELSDRIAKNLDALDGIYYIYTNTMLKTREEMDPDITFDEYMKAHPKMKYCIYLFYCQETGDVENVYQGLQKLLEDLPLTGVMEMYLMNEEMLGKVQDYLESHDKIYDEGKQMIKSYACGRFEFQEGILAITKDEVVHFLGEI